MRAGGLDQRITLREYSTVSDGAGGVTHTWADFATVPDVWAAVEPGAGASERMTEGGVAASAMYKFTIRYRSDLSEADGLLWGGEHYNIRRIGRRGGRQNYLVIEAERGAPK